MEAFFGLLIGIMAMSFGYMYVEAGVDVGDVVSGLLVRFRPESSKSPRALELAALGCTLLVCALLQ